MPSRFDSGQQREKLISLTKPLRSYAYGSSLVNLGRKILFYSPWAQRLYLADIDRQELVKEWALDGFVLAMALPDSDGVAVLMNDSLKIMERAGSAEFQLPAEYGFVSMAPRVSAFGFSDKDGLGVEVIRRLENGEWVQHHIEYSWKAIWVAEDLPPLYMTTQFSNYGEFLSVLSPLYGIYTVYNLLQPPNMLATQRYNWCSGNPGGSEENPLLSSYIWGVMDIDSFGSTFFGSNDGRLIGFFGEEPCAGMFTGPYIDEGWPAVNTPLLSPAPAINVAIYYMPNIAIYDPLYTVGVLQDAPGQAGSLRVLSSEVVNSQTQMLANVEDVCERPLASVALESPHVLVLCGDADAEHPDDRRYLVEGVEIPLEFALLDIQQERVVRRLDLSESPPMAYTVDVNEAKLYIISQGALASLSVFDLLNGGRRELGNLLVKGSL